jgi:hypothetical protein
MMTKSGLATKCTDDASAAALRGQPYDLDFAAAASALTQEIEAELARGEPSFPIVLDLSLRIKRVADDPHASLEDLAALVRIEPLLGARVLRMANSVSFNPFGNEVGNTPEAVRRIGLSNLRALALALAVEQLSSDLGSSALRALAEETWRHSLDVAAWAFAIARELRVGNADTALYCGLVAELGQLLMIARAGRYPTLSDDWHGFAELVETWAKPVTRKLTAALGLPTEIVDALPGETAYTGQWPPAELRDVLFVATLAADSDNPFDVLRGEVRPSIMEISRYRLDPSAFDHLLASVELERDEMLAVLQT